MSEVTFKDFQRLDIRIGKILDCEKIPGAKKLLKVSLDIGTEKNSFQGYPVLNSINFLISIS